MSDDSNHSEQPNLSETIDWEEVAGEWDEFDMVISKTEQEGRDLKSILLHVAEMGPEYTRPLVQCLTRRLCKAGVLSPARHGKHSRTRILEALDDLRLLVDEKAKADFDKECPF